MRREIIGPGEYGAIIHVGVDGPVEAWRMVEAPKPPGTVLVGEDEYVSEAEFIKLTPSEQAYLKKRGVSAFNLEQERIRGQSVEAYEAAVTFVEREKVAQEKWVAENIVEVGPGKEPILRADYEKLTPEHQKLLKKLGIEEFNKEISKPPSGRELFEKLIREGSLRPDAIYRGYDPVTGNLEYDVPARPLTGEQAFRQLLEAGKLPEGAVYTGYDKRTGEVMYEVPAAILTGAEALQKLKDEGKIPAEAKLISYDLKTQEVEYEVPGVVPGVTVTTSGAVIAGMPSETDVEQAFNLLLIKGEIPTGSKLISTQAEFEETGEVVYETLTLTVDYPAVEGEFLKLNLQQQGFAIRTALVTIKTKPFVDLTTDEREKVLTYYAENFLPYTEMEEIWVEHKAFLKEYQIDPLIGMTPVVGTVYFWDDMTPTWRGISIALDILILVPFVKAGITALRRARAPLRVGAAELTKMETAATRQMVQKLTKAYGTEVGKEYAAMSKAQTTYLKRLANIAETKKPTARMMQLAEAAERDLVNKTKLFVEDVRYRPGFDSPEIAKMMDDWPKDIVLNTRSAIESLKTTKVNIRVLEAEVARAESVLKAAQEKWPTEPAKWSDLMVDHALKQSKLAVAKTGGAEELFTKWQAAKAAGKTELALKLEADYWKALKSAEVEWGKGGMLSRGKGRIITAEPFAPTIGAPVRGAAVPTRLLPPAVAGVVVPGLALARAAVVVAPRVPEPITVPVTVPPTVAEVVVVTPTRTYTVPLTEFVTLSAEEIAVKYGTKLNIYVKGEVSPLEEFEEAFGVWKSPQQIVEEAQATATEAAIQAATEVAIQAAIKAATEAAARAATETEIRIAAETAAETQVKTITETAVRTEVRTRVATRLKTALRLRPKVPPPTVPEAVAVKKEYPAGTIVWRQGALWKIIPPPYTLRKPISSRTAPAGVTVLKGTPQETLTFLEGKVPFGNVSFDLGVTDGFIDVAKKRIVFRSDWQLKTDVGKRLPSPTKGISLEEAEALGIEVPKRGRVKRRVPKRRVEPTAGIIDLGEIKIL